MLELTQPNTFEGPSVKRPILAPLAVNSLTTVYICVVLGALFQKQTCNKAVTQENLKNSCMDFCFFLVTCMYRALQRYPKDNLSMCKDLFLQDHEHNRSVQKQPGLKRGHNYCVPNGSFNPPSKMSFCTSRGGPSNYFLIDLKFT